LTRREKNIFHTYLRASSRRPHHKFLDSACDFCYNDKKKVEECTFLHMAAKGVDNHARKDHGLQEHTSAVASGGFSARQTRCRFIVRKNFLKHKAG
jgi:hypothetical protein